MCNELTYYIFSFMMPLVKSDHVFKELELVEINLLPVLPRKSELFKKSWTLRIEEKKVSVESGKRS